LKKKKIPKLFRGAPGGSVPKNHKGEKFTWPRVGCFSQDRTKLPYRPSVVEKNPLGGWYQAYFPENVLRNQDFLGPSPPMGAASSWTMFGEQES